MPNIPQRRLLTSAIQALLEEAIQRPVGLAEAPRDNNGNQAQLPYIILNPLPSGYFSGPAFCGPNADAKFHYQVDSCGERGDQAELIADRVRETLIDRDESGALVNKVVFTGGKVMDQAVLGSTGKLDQVGQIWTVKEAYAFSVTSSS